MAAQDDETRVSPSSAGADDPTRITGGGDAELTRVAAAADAETVLAEGASAAYDEAYIQPGTVIKGRFVIEERVGRGGMGTVYKARDLRREELHDSQPHVALKFLNAELRQQSEALIALQREAKKAQRLAHPNIVTVYDFDRDGSLVYLSMEYLDGEPLDALVERYAGVGMSPAQALPLIERMARGLAYAHQEGIAHSDFKPSNVYVARDGAVKVLDLGIAQAVGLGGERRQLDKSYFDSSTLGAITPNYASPEMLAEQLPEPADDVYSLACVAYELLAGAHPFLDAKGRKMPADRAKALGLEPRSIKGVSRRHMRALRTGLALERSARFADAGAFIDAIKPRRKLQRSVAALLGALAISAAVSWFVVVDRSEMAIGLNDLPPAMAQVQDTLRLGDRVLADGQVDQAQNLYAQAWESAHRLDGIAQKDLFRLKVLVDRRIDRVTGELLERVEASNLGEFRLMQLQLALEYLNKGELGTRDEAIEAALRKIEQRLDNAKG